VLKVCDPFIYCIGYVKAAELLEKLILGGRLQTGRNPAAAFSTTLFQVESLGLHELYFKLIISTVFSLFYTLSSRSQIQAPIMEVNNELQGRLALVTGASGG